MSGIDIILALCILVGAYQGYKAGFLVELFSLFAVILGVLGGFKLMGIAMVLLASKFQINEKVLPYVAFAVVFILIVVVVNLLGKAIKVSVNKTLLGSVDQAAGALLAFVRTIFMFSIVLWIVDSLNFKLLSSWTEDSWLYPMVAGFAPKLTKWLAQFLPFFKDVF